MAVQDQLEQSKAIQHRVSRTFHSTSRVVLGSIGCFTYIRYAFLVADYVVDNPILPSLDVRRTTLKRIRWELLGRQKTSVTSNHTSNFTPDK
jgi:phytoene/squalene synthetase